MHICIYMETFIYSTLFNPKTKGNRTRKRNGKERGRGHVVRVRAPRDRPRQFWETAGKQPGNKSAPTGQPAWPSTGATRVTCRSALPRRPTATATARSRRRSALPLRYAPLRHAPLRHAPLASFHTKLARRSRPLAANGKQMASRATSATASISIPMSQLHPLTAVRPAAVSVTARLRVSQTGSPRGIPFGHRPVRVSSSPSTFAASGNPGQHFACPFGPPPTHLRIALRPPLRVRAYAHARTHTPARTPARHGPAAAALTLPHRATVSFPEAATRQHTRPPPARLLLRVRTHISQSGNRTSCFRCACGPV
ncbi:hypothetical protein TBLA_0D02970 [Henningerozyma blattae CBS 6284]|uniref:Uncharacterized protein n=1 Tax=Henningerozyma blattae (strain ATCC 34711 / CBS 6284 / DSM 70876 / NBRC 10599 / NRRL Y-10934 / UCD 77-7) TaxID=1071380 RepID=I2H345_HENB6|nr:hypothetical protein TBLA_0D02970 [Tetrapisispora blattae CBS 6284]CCH60797.1 hypothetical protein TBLA_0D02970 [Tetrapisispora blattae CBS 6284]